MHTRSKILPPALPCGALWLGLCGTALAADSSPGPGVGSVLQMLLGLFAVLGAFGAAAWLMKRSGAVGGGNQRALKLVASVAVGTRERVVLIEVGGQWIVAGVAPGSVSQLALMPRGELSPIAADADAQGGNAFAGFLRQVMERRNAK
jgi:flagellar protein FliO/FliZ